MKTRIAHFLFPVLGGSATTAFAADSALSGGGGPLIWFFIGFGALVLLVQAIPALVMLYSMMRAIFSSSEENKTATAAGHK